MYEVQVASQKIKLMRDFIYDIASMTQTGDAMKEKIQSEKEQ
jgi:hypothetical protein